MKIPYTAASELGREGEGTLGASRRFPWAAWERARRFVAVLLTAFAMLRGAVAAPGDLAAGFNPNFNSYPLVITVLPDGRTIAGGTFTTVGGTARSYLARLNVDGTLDASFTPTVSGPVNCAVLQADGKVIIGGTFTSVNGMTRNHAARLNADGTLDAAFDPNVIGECTAWLSRRTARSC